MAERGRCECLHGSRIVALLLPRPRLFHIQTIAVAAAAVVVAVVVDVTIGLAVVVSIGSRIRISL